MKNVFISFMETPMGILKIEGTEEHITSIEFHNGEYEDICCDSYIIHKAKRQLNEYFKGERKEFDLPLKLHGTDFQIMVWKELMKIPYGKVVTYGEIAKRIGNKKASRAVGNANNKNKIVIVVPCHRVVGANSKSGGYGGGVEKKAYLLELENKS